jgi:hypothetical protein
MKPEDSKGLGADSASFKKLNPLLFTYHSEGMKPPTELTAPKPKLTPLTSLPNLSQQMDTDEAKLNKTERAYLAHLRMLKVPNLRVQKLTFKLAHDTRLTPDFSYVDENGRGVMVDVKGFQREDALIKMKVAARNFSEYRFQIVKRLKGGGWDCQDVNP